MIDNCTVAMLTNPNPTAIKVFAFMAKGGSTTQCDAKDCGNYVTMRSQFLDAHFQGGMLSFWNKIHVSAVSTYCCQKNCIHIRDLCLFLFLLHRNFALVFCLRLVKYHLCQESIHSFNNGSLTTFPECNAHDHMIKFNQSAFSKVTLQTDDLILVNSYARPCELRSAMWVYFLVHFVTMHLIGWKFRIQPITGLFAKQRW